MAKRDIISISKIDYIFWTGVNIEDDEDEIFKKLACKAYRDMCRSLTYSKVGGTKNREKIIKGSISYFRDRISKLNVNFNSNKFDLWHKEICNSIIKKFNDSKILKSCDGKMTVGQVQKWVNLTLKYACMIFKYRESKKYDVIVKIKSCLHIPLDSYILEYITDKNDVTLKEREIKQYLLIGSKISNLRQLKSYGNQKAIKKSDRLDTYMGIQKNLRKSISNFNSKAIPIDWEIKHWCIAANSKNDD